MAGAATPHPAGPGGPPKKAQAGAGVPAPAPAPALAESLAAALRGLPGAAGRGAEVVVRDAAGRVVGSLSLAAAAGDGDGDDGGDEDDDGPEEAPPEVRAALAPVRAERGAGNERFGAGQFEEAVFHYGQALAGLEAGPLLRHPAAANAEAAVLHENLAAAHLALGAAAEALRHCRAALALDPRRAKALYRQGQALLRRGEVAAAAQSFERALAAAPDNYDVLAALDHCDDLLEAGAPAAPGAGDPGDAAAAGAAAAGGDPVPMETVARLMDAVRAEYEETGRVAGCVFLVHAGKGWGSVKIDGAFASQGTLREALGFVRGQHGAFFAQCACACAQLRDVAYPRLQYAHPWPAGVDVEADGVVVEALTRAERRAWLLPVAADGALLEPVELDAECRLLDEDLTPFP